MITAVERPHRLAYDPTVVSGDSPTYDTATEVTITPASGGHRIRLVRRGFPTTGTRDEFADAWPSVLEELDRRVRTDASGRQDDPDRCRAAKGARRAPVRSGHPVILPATRRGLPWLEPVRAGHLRGSDLGARTGWWRLVGCVDTVPSPVVAR